jgi:hypothetical protein
LAGIANTNVTAAMTTTPHSIPIKKMRIIFLFTRLRSVFYSWPSIYYFVHGAGGGFCRAT